MKMVLALAAVCGAAYLIYDQQSVKLKLNETFRAGTLQGVETCVEYSKSNLLSEDTTRNACVERFQKEAYGNGLANGRAGPRARSEVVYLEGSLENKTSDFVTTWVQFSFKLIGPEGKEETTWADTYIWLEPHSSADFEVVLPELKPEDIKGAKFCDHEDKSPKSCMSWGVVKVKGIEI